MKNNFKKRLLSAALATVMLIPMGISALAAEQDDAFDYKVESVTGEFDGYIVKRRESNLLHLMDADSDENFGELYEPIDAPEGVEELEYADGYYLADTLEAAKELAELVDVEYIEPNYIVHMYDSDAFAALDGQPEIGVNDIHLATMNADKVRDYGITGEDLDVETDMGNDGDPVDRIVIAVIDSGLNPSHEDIDYTHILEGANFVQSNTTSTNDTSGHGTFVTGEILATTGNGLGIDGIAENVYVMPLKVFVSNSTSTSVIINAVNYAVKQRQLFDETSGEQGENICVINMSLGSESYSSGLKAAVDSAIESGIIVICAAGNDGNTKASYPAQYAIGVGSTDADGGLDAYAGTYTQVLNSSNIYEWKNKVWVSAPGTYYTSLWHDGGYYYGSGTSFSSPQVAALAAIAVSLKNDLTSYYAPEDTVDNGSGSMIKIENNHNAFKRLLKETSNLTDYNSQKTEKYKRSESLTDEGQDIRYGWGMVDFDKMVTTLVGNETKDTKLTVKVVNAVGTELTEADNNLSVSLYLCDENGEATSTEIMPQNGVYALEKGQRYRYIVTADKYNKCESDFVAILPERKLVVRMEGKDYFTSFTVRNTDDNMIPNPVIRVNKISGAEIAQNTDGSFSTKNGNYTYTISAEGYFPISGSFTINDAENEYEDDKYTIDIMLEGAQDICSITFSITGVDGDPYGEVTLYDNGGKIVLPYLDGAWKLVPGSYSYTVESDYYKATSGELTVEESDKGTEKNIAIEMQDRLYWAFIDIMPLTVAEMDSTTVEVKDSNGEVAVPFNNAKGEYRVTNGTYSYKVQAEGYKTATGSFSMESKLLNIDVKLEEGKDNGSSGNSGNGSGGGSGGSSGGSSGGGSSSGSGGGSSDSSVSKKDQNDIKTERGKYAAVKTEYHELIDVKESDWFYEGVNFTMTVGLFEGTSKNKFSPAENMNRAMLVTVLYRLSGENVSANESGFDDVEPNAYYAQAIAWGKENGLVDGVSANRFAPNALITREQLAVLMYRYALWTEADPSVMGDGASLVFTDYGKVSEYALNAINWAYEQELMEGAGGKLNPGSYATRAETAVILTRFLKNVL